MLIKGYMIHRFANKLLLECRQHYSRCRIVPMCEWCNSRKELCKG